MRTLFPLLLALIASGEAAAQTHLRWRWEKGEELRLVLTQSTQSETIIGDMSLEGASEMTLDLTWSVVDVIGENALIKQSIRRVRVKAKAPAGSPLVWDTDSEEAPEGPAAKFDQAVRPLLGAKAMIRMSQRGEILEVTPAGELTDSLKDAGAANQLGELFTTDGLRKLFGQTMAPLPQSPVRVGDQWNSESTVATSIGRFRQQSTFTYQGTQQLDDRTAEKIDVSTSVQAAPDAGPKDARLEVVKQKSDGVIWFDPVAGKIVRSSGARSLTLKVIVGEAVVTQRLESETTLKLAP